MIILMTIQKTSSLNFARNIIGYIPQQPFLFNATIRENLTWAKPDGTDAEIIEACGLANAVEFIETMEKKYDTLVGERGVRLSGGQAQRICLARALIRKPQFLILDEATASVDAETEKKIKEALTYLIAGRTTILIAHRLSTLEGADRILVMKSGKLVGSGTHESMINSETEYAQLFRSQIHL